MLCRIIFPARGLGIGHRVGGLYHLDRLQLSASATTTVDVSVSAVACSPDRWHRRLGHLSSARLKLLSSSGVLGSVSLSPLSACMGCRLAKYQTLPFPSSESVSVASFDLVHSDIWGPSLVTSLGGFSYYVSFVDDFSRYT